MITPVTLNEVLGLLPNWPADIHKGSRGRLLIMGGSVNYIGAPSLTALGALRTGSGVVTLLSLPSVCAASATRLPEVVYHPTGDVASWPEVAFAEEAIMNAAILGPGLGRSRAASVVVKAIWQNWQKPLLVDGDGLFELAHCATDCPSRENDCYAPERTILTPHEGEAARLLGITPDKVHKNREFAARMLADCWGCVLLKGHGSLLAQKNDDNIRQLDWGGPELSVPGSGDVLAGCIGAFLGMGLSAFDAAMLGVAVHGMAGDKLREAHGIDGVLASEVAHTIRDVLHELRMKAQAANTEGTEKE